MMSTRENAYTNLTRLGNTALLLVVGYCTQLLLKVGSSDAAFVVPSSGRQQRRVGTSSYHLASVLGGDFAGYRATYDLEGRLIPVPEHYVPESLLEWGQAPSALEVLVSEDVVVVDRLEDNSGWKRHELTVLPETGCGVDNLEVIQRVEEISDESYWQNSPDADTELLCSSFIYPMDTPSHLPNKTRIETCLFISEDHRCRSLVDVVVSQDACWTPTKPITVFLERRISSDSSSGTRADGGGLDGRSVSGWIGPTLRRECDQRMEKAEERRWTSESAAKHVVEDESLSLPGNLTLSYSKTAESGYWQLQVGHVDAEAGLRRVVEHTWNVDKKSWSTAMHMEKGDFVSRS